ncbi:MAG: PAS domain-containing protein [Oscillatoriales cyanobacterium SM2_1_8]|nr:PAS domain-containing protein [Oscillatoriales cyanobacterium SM2_1_8]
MGSSLAEILYQKLRPAVRAYAELYLQAQRRQWEQEGDRLRSAVRLARRDGWRWQQQFYELIHRLEGVFGLWDVETQRWLYLSPHSETLWGIGREQLLAEIHSWVTTVHPDDRARVAQQLREPAYPVTLEYRVVPEKWVRDRWFGVPDETGKVYRVLRIVEDISDRQRVERLKGEFISIVSHELRTPSPRFGVPWGCWLRGCWPIARIGPKECWRSLRRRWSGWCGWSTTFWTSNAWNWIKFPSKKPGAMPANCCRRRWISSIRWRWKRG